MPIWFPSVFLWWNKFHDEGYFPPFQNVFSKPGDEIYVSKTFLLPWIFNGAPHIILQPRPTNNSQHSFISSLVITTHRMVHCGSITIACWELVEFLNICSETTFEVKNKQTKNSQEENIFMWIKCLLLLFHTLLYI